MNSLPLHNDARHMIDAFRNGVVQPAGSTAGGSQKTIAVENATADAFSTILSTKVNELRFSAHAAARIRSRNMELTPEVMQKLEKAVENAAAKGARDSLVLLDASAFIVNIPNRTVVTAMDCAQMKDNIFTNIDSAVIVD